MQTRRSYTRRRPRGGNARRSQDLVLRSGRKTGEMPEWLKGTDCKSVGSAYVGSNPTLSTIRLRSDHSRGYSSMVEQQPSKLNTRVRFPLPPPNILTELNSSVPWWRLSFFASAPAFWWRRGREPSFLDFDSCFDCGCDECQPGCF